MKEQREALLEGLDRLWFTGLEVLIKRLQGMTQGLQDTMAHQRAEISETMRQERAARSATLDEQRKLATEMLNEQRTRAMADADAITARRLEDTRDLGRELIDRAMVRLAVLAGIGLVIGILVLVWLGRRLAR